MKPTLIHIGLDVDDTRFHGSALDEQTSEVLDFNCRPSLKALFGPLEIISRIMKSLLEQLKKSRKQLGMKQHDMMMRVGISRQRYQRLESKGNPRLDTLELIAKGLNSEFLLIP